MSDCQRSSRTRTGRAQIASENVHQERTQHDNLRLLRLQSEVKRPKANWKRLGSRRACAGIVCGSTQRALVNFEAENWIHYQNIFSNSICRAVSLGRLISYRFEIIPWAGGWHHIFVRARWRCVHRPKTMLIICTLIKDRIKFISLFSSSHLRIAPEQREILTECFHRSSQWQWFRSGDIMTASVCHAKHNQPFLIFLFSAHKSFETIIINSQMRYSFYVSRLELRKDNALGNYFCVRNSHECMSYASPGATADAQAQDNKYSMQTF